MLLTQALHTAAQLYPEHPATLCHGRERTYRQALQRVARLAAGLRNHGLEEGGRIAILALNSDRYQEGLLACWWAGGVVNPVNIRWSAGEITYSLEDSGARVLIVDDQHLPLLSQILASLRHPPLLVYAGEGATPSGMLGFEALIAESAPIADAGAGGESLAVILYTGGTTGRPKGVMLSHDNLLSGVLMRLADLPPVAGRVGLSVAPLFHIAGLASAYARILTGASNIYLPLFDALQVLETVQRERANEILLVPTMLQALLDHPSFAEFDLSSLERVLYGASPISAALLDRAVAGLPSAGFVHLYGLTENGGQISANPPCNHKADGGLSRSVGRPTLGQWVRIVDEQGHEVPRNTVGELIARGPSVMQGYWNRPEDTAATLRDGWLYTGDAAYMDDSGHLFVVDRIKDMVISGGENIYSAEVENVLARHPAVALCAVIGVPHDAWGEAVHAVVTLKPGRQTDAEGLIRHCREALAAYKCPKSIEFRESLPLSGAGKILKRDLREPYWQSVRQGASA
ncbi:AMP-dependent synthetase/ligase [Pseudomonas sp. ATCC 13867]|uniref:long-chain-fatty-acid--CoA ligase n=1 Tax=Pseudomonas sp. ATCC 13867 TaxID=1294143 RepID=UPI0002C4EEB6|nr:long-chain-fatty-acid--CoA ligase [Pseudomonas sp. ATCC 13867]AGI24313.1 AMP-dependent synthetase/ligase [Pseudomonas sp. ATCC 13867]